MALARCKDHPPDNTRTKSPYTAFALPLGHPNTGLICGRNKCRNAAYLWLNESEQGRYNEGARIFQVGSLAVKIQVLNELILDQRRPPQANKEAISLRSR
jgi:hypothetical protein